MIDTVRTAVLTILNKNNYGSVSPSDFNMIAKFAQLDIFEDLFVKYNIGTNRENMGRSGEDSADTTRHIQEVFDLLSVEKSLLISSNSTYNLPTVDTVGYDYYRIKDIKLRQPLLYGTTTGSDPAFNVLTDTNNNLLLVSVGDIVFVKSSADIWNEGVVTEVTDEDNIVTDLSTLEQTGLSYVIFKRTVSYVYVEKVPKSRVHSLVNSNLTAPTLSYPIYTQDGTYIDVYPLDEDYYQGSVVSDFIRYPKAPKWTYITIGNGSPVFDQTNKDYQDFELPEKYMPELVVKILKYLGLSIREAEVVKVMATEEAIQTQNK